MTLSGMCDQFQAEIESLEPIADDYVAQVRHLVTRLARDAAEQVANYSMGEVAAVVERCRGVLAALSAEAENPEDRRRRYDRQQAVLSLVVLADGVRVYHTSRGKAADVDALRDLVADALGGLVERAE